MNENRIEAVDDNILRFPITKNGKETGDYIEFDMEDIELPFRLDESYKLHYKNVEEIKSKLKELEKEEDIVQEGLMSKRQKKEIEAIEEFYKKEEKALDLFLGEGAMKKLLQGRKPYVTMFGDIYERIAPIFPQLKLESKNIIERIKTKYSEKEDNIIE